MKELRLFATSGIFKAYLIVILAGCLYCYSIDPEIKLDETQGLLILNAVSICIYWYYNILK